MTKRLIFLKHSKNSGSELGEPCLGLSEIRLSAPASPNYSTCPQHTGWSQGGGGEPMGDHEQEGTCQRAGLSWKMAIRPPCPMAPWESPSPHLIGASPISFQTHLSSAAGSNQPHPNRDPESSASTFDPETCGWFLLSPIICHHLKIT